MQKIFHFLFLTTTITSTMLHPYTALHLNRFEEDEYCLYHEPSNTPENLKKNKIPKKTNKKLTTDEGTNKNKKKPKKAEKQIKCGLCILSVLQEDQKCHPIAEKTQIKNCLFYSDEKTCKSCHYNYKLNSDKTQCGRIHLKNCLQQEGQNCIACKNGILPKDGNCSDTENSCKIQNCKVCGKKGNVEFCYVCKSGFAIYLENKETEQIECIRENFKTQNCNLLRPGVMEQCAVCDVNYYLDSNDVCVKSSKYDIDLFEFGVAFKVFLGLWVLVF